MCIRDRVWLAGLVPAGGDVRGAEAGEALDATEKILDDVLPVAEHVDDDAAVVLLAVVPRGALEFLELAGEHPVAKLAADREDFAEETGVDEIFQFEEAGQPELVLQ